MAKIKTLFQPRMPGLVPLAIILPLILGAAAPQVAGVEAAPSTAAVVPVAAVVPSGLQTSEVTSSSFRLSWTASSGAVGYRLYSGTKANGTGRTRLDTTSTSAVIAGLKPNTVYYVRMASKDSKGKISAYTSDVKVTTPSATTLARPSNVTVTSVKTTSAEVSWTPAAGMDTHRLYYGTDPSGAGRTGLDVSNANRVTLSGLTPGTRYYVRVAARQNGKSSTYTSDVAFTTTAAAVSADVNVATYNVFANRTAPSGQSWASRRSAVVDNIKGQDLDVIGLQEASQNPLPGTSTSDRRFYFKDLVAGLPGFKLTDESAYNCRNDYSPAQPGSGGGTRCSGSNVVNQGASAGTRIAYDASTMRMISSGSKLLSDYSTTQGSSYNDRYMAWAVLEKNGTGKRLFFVNTHLDVNSAAERVKQRGRLQDSIEQLNTADLPVVLVGDFNVYPFQNSGADYRKIITPLKNAGYRDPLGTQPNTYKRASTGLAETFLGHPNCDSITHFRRKLPLASSPIGGQKDCWYSSYSQKQHNGNNIDYIFTKGVARVKEWETVMRLDSSGNLVGVIPSDHHMLRSLVTL